MARSASFPVHEKKSSKSHERLAGRTSAWPLRHFTGPSLIFFYRKAARHRPPPTAYAFLLPLRFLERGRVCSGVVDSIRYKTRDAYRRRQAALRRGEKLGPSRGAKAVSVARSASTGGGGGGTEARRERCSVVMLEINACRVASRFQMCFFFLLYCLVVLFLVGAVPR